MFFDDDLSPSRPPESEGPDDPFDRAACLAPLPPAVIAALRSRNQPLTFAKGAVIFRQSTPGDRVLLVVRGRVKLSRKIGPDRSRTLRILNPGDCHCCSPVGDGSPSPV
ncbi:MAG TPA: cyclic nucleotide-binding domain-containing protein, partial [Candidatus Saccharimonadales bacterium]|nr:cyclic nucleotide-binding domain-containing protein [Candidatus Saccharimonadales bacterium]